MTRPLLSRQSRLSRLAGSALLASALLLPALGHAAPLQPGAALPRLQISDQNERPVALTPATRLVIFAADKAGSELAQGVLKAQPAGVLDRLHAVYIADISGMPSLITKMFALPKLRELPFPVGLVRDAAQTADLPRQAGQVTVLVLDAQQKLQQVKLAGDAAALKAALGL
jgi:hypothetical protein